MFGALGEEVCLISLFSGLWFRCSRQVCFIFHFEGYVEVPRDEDSEDDSDDDENKNGDSASTEGIIAKAKEEAKKNVDEEETKVSK